MADREKTDIGALWTKAKRDGGKFMSGKIVCPGCGCESKIVVFPNKYKTSDKHPSARIYPDKPKDSGWGGGEQSPPPQSASGPIDTGDDLPPEEELAF